MRPNREAFGDAERRRLEDLALQIAPIVRHRIFEKQLEEALAARGRSLAQRRQAALSERSVALASEGGGGGGPRAGAAAEPCANARPAQAVRGLRDPPRPTESIPFYQQTTSADCGAACMTMVLASFGKEVPMREVRDVMGSQRDGADARQILAAADWYGLRTRAVRVTEIENLECLPSRSILHWQFHHFVVLEADD